MARSAAPRRCPRAPSCKGHARRPLRHRVAAQASTRHVIRDKLATLRRRPPAIRYGSFETYSPAQDRRSPGGLSRSDRARNRVSYRPNLCARGNQGAWDAASGRRRGAECVGRGGSERADRYLQGSVSVSGQPRQAAYRNIPRHAAAGGVPNSQRLPFRRQIRPGRARDHFAGGRKAGDHGRIAASESGCRSGCTATNPNRIDEFGRTDTPDQFCAGTCSGSDTTGRRPGAKPGAADRARSGAHADASATGRRARDGASAADCLARGSPDIACAGPQPDQTRVGRSAYRRQFGNGCIVPLSSNATQASFCAWQL
jgi:hypothetical protein